jgi:hypothetical protein
MEFVTSRPKSHILCYVSMFEFVKYLSRIQGYYVDFFDFECLIELWNRLNRLRLLFK